MKRYLAHTLVWLVIIVAASLIAPCPEFSSPGWWRELFIMMAVFASGMWEAE